jgi:Xaa-Pro aminopeptidase
MRLHKAPVEIDLMRRAAEITREGHLAGLTAIRPGAMEYEVEAAIEHTFRRRGAEGPGYPTIVGSGPNATILHYISNGREIRPGDLVLIDAGAELDFYNADVTRTYPVGGRYPSPARDVVAAVLAAQAAALDAVRPGARFDDVHQAALQALVRSMIDLGLLAGDPEALIKGEAYRPFYMHRTSHWLGLDVHDVGAYRKDGESRRLEPGMVLTVEPGIYIAPDADAPAGLRGIGVRIEDDVLVTASGHEVLTEAIPRDIDAIEALVPLV